MKYFDVYCEAYGTTKKLPQIILCGAASLITEKMFQLFKFDPRWMIQAKSYGEMLICMNHYAIITLLGPLEKEQVLETDAKFICFGGGNPFAGQESPDNFLVIGLHDEECTFKIAEFLNFQGFNGVQYNADLQFPYLFGPFEIEEKHNIITLAKRMFLEELKWAKAGFNFRSVQKIGQLFDICRRCSAFKKNERNPGQEGKCNICGCRMHVHRKRADNKLALNTTECPVGQWGPEIRIDDKTVLAEERVLDKQLALKKTAMEKTMNGHGGGCCGKKV
jgi:hypothetical protein